MKQYSRDDLLDYIAQLEKKLEQVEQSREIQENIGDSQCEMLMRINSEYDATMRTVERQNKALTNLADGLNRTLTRVRSANEDLEREIAERKRIEEELLASKQAAEAASRAKSQFLANMSHEIRTPLGTIIGMTEVLQNCELGVRETEYMNRCVASGRVLLSIIDNILDISKIEHGRMEACLEQCDPSALLKEAVSAVIYLGEEKGLKITADIAADVPQVVFADSRRLTQVLVNLLGNAVKFTEEGGITATLRMEQYRGSVGLRYEIIDTGIGIPTENLPTIFEPFTQVDSSRTRSQSGTGLGLAITKSLVDFLGGEISVKSGPEGSVFSFIVPTGDSSLTTETDMQAEKASTSEPMPALKVLLAEDNENNRMLMEFYLRKAPFSISFAEDGQEAVAMYRQGQYDIVIMDIQMPVMDGYEATKAIRKEEADNGRPATPIIALTANAFREDEKRCMEAGCNYYLSKPVRGPQLIDTILEAVGR